jgi:hypothetical protein
MHEQSSERWAPIPGAPGYEASTHGGIRKRKRYRVGEALTYVRLGRTPGGYRTAYIGIRSRGQGVHRLVLMAFVGVPPEGQRWYAHHIDGVPDHNCLSNLEWLTSAAHGVKHRARARSPLPRPPRALTLSDDDVRAMMRRLPE